VIYVNNAFGRGGREMFLKFLKDRGKSVVADISTEVQQADFTPELTRVRASGADARDDLQPRGRERADDDPDPEAGDHRRRRSATTCAPRRRSKPAARR